jgi:hypothetical protein
VPDPLAECLPVDLRIAAWADPEGAEETIPLDRSVGRSVGWSWQSPLPSRCGLPGCLDAGIGGARSLPS